MTGKELMAFIVANGLEEYDIGFYRDSGSSPDFLYGGLDAEIDNENKTVVF